MPFFFPELFEKEKRCGCICETLRLWKCLYSSLTLIDFTRNWILLWKPFCLWVVKTLLPCLQFPVVAIFSLLLLFGCWSTLKWLSIFFKLFCTVAFKDSWAVLLMVCLKSFMDLKKCSNTLLFQELTLLLWTCLLHVLSLLSGGTWLSEVISGIRYEATRKGEINVRKDSSLNFVTHLLIARWKMFVFFICVNFLFLPWCHFFLGIFIIVLTFLTPFGWVTAVLFFNLWKHIKVREENCLMHWINKF